KSAILLVEIQARRSSIMVGHPHVRPTIAVEITPGGCCCRTLFVDPGTLRYILEPNVSQRGYRYKGQENQADQAARNAHTILQIPLSLSQGGSHRSEANIRDLC